MARKRKQQRATPGQGGARYVAATGTWEALWSDGGRKRSRRGFATEDLARTYAAAQASSLRDVQAQARALELQADAGTLTVVELVQLHLEDLAGLVDAGEVTANTVTRRRWGLAKLVEHHGSMRAAAVRSHHTTQLLEALVKEKRPDGTRRYSSTSLRGVRSDVSALWGWAVEQRYHPGPPPSTQLGRRAKAATKTQPKAQRPDTATLAWEVEHLEALLAGCLDTTHGIATALAAGAGLRRGELAGLRWGDVDLQAEQLHVRQAAKVTSGGVEVGTLKTEKSARSVDLIPPLRDALQRWRAQQRQAGLLAPDTGYVVAWTPDAAAGVRGVRPGDPVHPAALTRTYVPRTLAACGCPPAGLHELRDVYAVLGMSADRPTWGWPLSLYEMSGSLGHANVAITASAYATQDHQRAVRGAQARRAAALAAGL